MAPALLSVLNNKSRLRMFAYARYFCPMVSTIIEQPESVNLWELVNARRLFILL